jgi:hypothetical protein
MVDAMSDAADGAADFLDRRDAILGGRLHAGDLCADLLGRLGGLRRELLNLGCDDRKAAAGFACARRLPENTVFMPKPWNALDILIQAQRAVEHGCH